MSSLSKITITLVTLFLSLTLSAQKIKVQMSAPYQVLESGKKTSTFIKVEIESFDIEEAKRPPVNVAIVLDKSSSMSGSKIEQAKVAAINAVKRLQKDDIVSIITYDSTVQVIVPATKVSDKETVIQAIQQIQPTGSTALFAGVGKGAEEVRKFLRKDAVNRVILLSDGQANVGPSTPAELGELGTSLIKEGISVSTIGLGTGYNEDLMVRLATKSDGNHMFAESSDELLVAFDKEFGTVLSVVAQEVAIKITCQAGVRPVKVLGKEAEISGQEVVIFMNQMCKSQNKHIILEVEVPAGENNESKVLATTEVTYQNMITNKPEKTNGSFQVKFSNDKNVIAASLDKETMNKVISEEATVRNALAIKLRDEGKIAEAQKLIILNCNIINNQLSIAPSKELEIQWGKNKNDLDNIGNDQTWGKQRKRMYETNNDQTQSISYDNIPKETPKELPSNYNTK